jgi:hypothetical protein
MFPWLWFMSGCTHTGLKVVINDARWQDVLLYKCWYHKTDFRSTSNVDDNNDEIT